MDRNFEKVMSIEDRYEGGYSNHPNDPGGPTNRGVIQRVYDAYRKSKGQQTRSVKNLTDEEWRDIFHRQYWLPINGPRLPAGVDLVVMDGAINSGIYQSGKWLQRALGNYYTGAIDGHIGEGTLAAINAHPDHDKLIAAYLARRLGMLQNLKTWGDFGRGWTARIVNVRDIGQAWATGSVGPAPVAAHLEGGANKAYASDVFEPPVSEQTGTQGSTAGFGLSGLLAGAREQLAPLVGTSDLVDKIVLYLIVAGIAVGVVSALYALWASFKNKRARAAIDGGIVAEVPGMTPFAYFDTNLEPVR